MGSAILESGTHIKTNVGLEGGGKEDLLELGQALRQTEEMQEHCH